MSAASESSIAKRSIRELTYALIAGGLTLAVSFGLYLTVPRFLSGFAAAKSEVQHPRIYRTLPDGGEIEYRAAQQGSLAGMKHDLEILGRRFERGQFEMIGIAGGRNADAVKNMQRHKNSLRTSVSERDGSAVLRIQSADGAAVRDLHAYLKYLEAKWKFAE